MSWAVLTHRRTRLAGSVLLSVGVLALVLWHIDVGAAVDAIAEANGLLLLAALAVSLVTTWGMAWRWQLLLIPAAYASRSGGSSASTSSATRQGRYCPPVSAETLYRRARDVAAAERAK